MTQRSNRLIWLLARKWAQPIWRSLWKLSLAGMNFQNDDPSLNGEHAFLQRALANKEGVVVFDVGANKGHFCADALGVNPDAVIHAFEPNPPTFSRLESRFAKNSNIRLNNVGAADQDGSLEIYDHVTLDGTEQASFLREAFEDVYRSEHKSVSVPVIRLDDYVSSNEVDRIDLLKIDVEGFELAVLTGAQQTLQSGIVEAVMMEFNVHHVFASSSIWKLSKLLDGYDIYRLLPGGMEPLVTPHTPYNTRVEIFKYSNLVALKRGDV